MNMNRIVNAATCAVLAAAFATAMFADVNNDSANKKQVFKEFIDKTPVPGEGGGAAAVPVLESTFDVEILDVPDNDVQLCELTGIIKVKGKKENRTITLVPAYAKAGPVVLHFIDTNKKTVNADALAAQKGKTITVLGFLNKNGTGFTVIECVQKK